jgi:predicted homoserine dehydrogenase-like protein
LEQPSVIGVVGTGYLARGLLFSLEQLPDVSPGPFLTRRDKASCTEFPRPDLLTNSLEELLGNCDLVVECSGHPLHAATVVDAALSRGLPVLTSDVEFHVTLGSCFEGRGYLTEAEGDQPGTLAALRAEALAMGFTPNGYGNFKRYLELDPTPENMRYWAERQGISLHQVTAFTDGTKVQLEMALVANAFGADILQPGMRQLPGPDTEAFARQLAAEAETAGRPLIEFSVAPDYPAGVLLTATLDDPRQAPYLDYLKLGAGPSYALVRPYHLCHLEIIKTIRSALAGAPPLLTNGHAPAISVAAVAKRDLAAGESIERGIGGFETRGICVRNVDEPDHVPIGLLFDATLVAPVAAGERLTWKHVELPDSFALRSWRAHARELASRAAGDSPEDLAKTAPDRKEVA